MGILSFFCFGIIFGTLAFTQGNSALAAIDRGEADPAERGKVNAGRICGLIGAILSVLFILGRIGLLVTGHRTTGIF